MKRFITIALSLCLMVSTAACGNKGSSESTGETTAFDTTDTAAQTAAPEKTQTTTTTAPQPLMPPMAKASEYLNFESDDLINSISTTYDNKLVLECTPEELVVYGEEAPMNIYVYDPVDERVVSSFALANAGECFRGIFKNGGYVTDDLVNNRISVYDKDGGRVNSGDINLFYSAFSLEDDCLYGFDADYNIIKVTSDGSCEKVFDSTGQDEMCKLMPFSSNAVKRSPLASDSDPYKSVLFSFKTGEEFAQVRNISYDSFEIKNGFCVLDNDWENISASFLTSSFDERDETVIYNFLGRHIFECQSHPDNEYIMAKCEDENNQTQVIFVDPLNGKAAFAGIDVSYSTYISGTYMSSAGRWFIAVGESAYGSPTSTKLIMTDPSLLSFDITAEKSQKQETPPTPCGEKMQPYREIADEIEKEYGVRILIGDEVYDAVDDTGYTYISIEDSLLADDEMSAFDDEEFRSYLEGLRRILDMYPEGFFEHFKDKNGEGGLRIVMVGDLKTDEYSAFTPGGISYTFGSWYNIALPCYSFSEAIPDLHHEVWHNVEALVTYRYGLDETAWAALNPEGFEYISDYDAFGERTDLNGYTITNAPAGVYDSAFFAAEYGLVNALEDRATIIEYLFFCNFDDSFEPVPMAYYDTLIQYPNLKKKLDLLAEWSSQEFGYVYWDEMYKKLHPYESEAA